MGTPRDSILRATFFFASALPSSQILAWIPLHSCGGGNAFLLSDFRKICFASFYEAQFSEADACRNSRAVESANVKISGSSPSKDEACLAVAEHLVIEPEPMDFVGCLIELADTPFEDLHLVDLPVVTAGLLLIEPAVEPLGLQIAGYAESIRAMCLLKAEADTGMLRDVAVCILKSKKLYSEP